MKITISSLRRIISEEVSRLYEAEVAPEKSADKTKPGAESAKDTKGSLDVKSLATALQADPVLLRTAIQNLRAGKRTPKDDKILGDLVAKLIQAPPESTQKAMNILKKVEEQ